MNRIGILAACLIAVAPTSYADFKPPLRNSAPYFRVWQSAKQVASPTSEQTCRETARSRTTTPGAERVTVQAKTGSGQLIAPHASLEACLAAVSEKLTADGSWRPTDGLATQANVNSCVVSWSYATTFQPPTCVATYNIGATYVKATTPPPPPGLAPPSNFSAVVLSQNAINLSWANAAGAGAVDIERCQGANCSNFTRLSCYVGTTRQHGSLTAATPYSYRIRSSRNTTCSGDTGNLSEWSSVISATTQSAPEPVNQPPTISGSPALNVSAGTAYAFRPAAVDPEGAALTFSITNRPSWANFDTSTGRLSGTPATNNVGTYSNIVIAVSDGRLAASMPAFAIAVLAPSNDGQAVLSWTPPTRNTDNTSLSNLAGYRVVYGTSETALTQTIQIANPGVSSYTVRNLAPGTYYFAVKAYTNNGRESDASNVARKVVE